jgi:hypothetical protein
MYTQENDRAIGRWSADEELSNTNHRKKERKKEREEPNVHREQLPLLMSCRYVHERA